ncbi:MAG: histidine kinase dimerization/phospho-acceptor domain-containing protein [Pseudomonadota bacterium]
MIQLSPETTAFYRSTLITRRRIILLTAFVITAFMVPVYHIMQRVQPFDPGVMLAVGGTALAPTTVYLLIVIVTIFLAIAGAVRLQFTTDVALSICLFFLSLMTICLGYLFLITVANDEGRVFFMQGLFQVLIVAHVFSVFPFLVLLSFSILICLASIITSKLATEWAPLEASFYVQELISINVVLLLAAKLLETKAKQNWILQSSISSASDRREDEHRRETEWLSFTAHFLRHELRNALTGISTSLVLLKRRLESESQLTLAQSAEHSVLRMRQLLDRAGSATAIEADLVDADLIDTDLVSELRRAVETQFGELPDSWNLNVGVDQYVVTAAENCIRVGLEHCIRYLARVCSPPNELTVALEEIDSHVKLVVRYVDPNRSTDLMSPRFSTQKPDHSPHFDLFIAKRAFETASGSLKPLTGVGEEIHAIEISIPLGGRDLSNISS